VVAKYPHPPSAFKATFNEIADVGFLPYMATVLPYLLPFFFSTLVFKASHLGSTPTAVIETVRDTGQ
jgi:hypothetical protein